MIPHHFHLIWIGRRFPFVNRLAVESLRQSNPGARITIHYEDPPGNADWKALAKHTELRPLDLPSLLASLRGPRLNPPRERWGTWRGGRGAPPGKHRGAPPRPLRHS